MVRTTPTNDDIASALNRIADLLEFQDANPFRVRAYRNAAGTVQSSQKSVAGLLQDGNSAALEKLPNIGQSIARLIAEYVSTGRLTTLERLQGEVSPEFLFTKVPGVGAELARRIVNQLDIHTLEELELAAYDGRLRKVEGFGPRRIAAVRSSLAGMLNRSAQRKKVQRVKSDTDQDEERPSVKDLLEIDAEYRRRSEAGELPKIAPRRFNPEKEAWLPILHTECGSDWNCTVLYSNTERAHELEKTHDWVVIYFERNGDEHQNTIVTETSGPLKGKRVVRGREAECEQYYAAQTN